MKTLAMANAMLVAAGCSQTETVPTEHVVAVNDLITQSIPTASEPATLLVYACPNLLSGCSLAAYKSGDTCYPVTVTPGTCIDTKIPITPASRVTLAGCTANCGDCGEPASFPTPVITLESTWYSGVSWFCNTMCEAPPVCP